MRKKRLDVSFPLGGLNRKQNYQNQPPYTTMDCSNVRPTDVFERRQRGGSRPGTGTDITVATLDGRQTTRWIGSVDYLSESGIEYTGDDFRIIEGETISESLWTSPTWIGGFPRAVVESFGSISITSDNHQGAVYQDVDDLDTTSPYEVAIYIVPYQNAHWGSYSLFARMNNSSPNALADGVQLQITIEEGDKYYVNLYRRVGGVTTTSTYSGGEIVNPAKGGWLRLVIDGDNLAGYWLNDELFTGVSFPSASLTHTTHYRTGFSTETTIPGGATIINSFMLAHGSTALKQTIRRKLACIVDEEATPPVGRFRHEVNPGVLVNLAGTFGYQVPIQGAEYLQKIYFADYDKQVFASGTDGVVVNGVFDASGSYASWNATDIDSLYADLVIVLSDITGGSGVIADGAYKISSVHDTNGLTLTGLGVGDSATTCSYRVVRGIKYYDPAASGGAGTIGILTASTGTVPHESRLIAAYRDRLVLAGTPQNPHVWYMSRQGDPTDWDYSQTDAGAAVSGTSTTTAQIGEPITALAAGENDYLMIGCTNSLWIMRGDPSYNGSLDNLSRSIGVIGPNAWCRGPANEFIFLSKDGLYATTGGNPPISISRERMPQELLNVDTTLNAVSLAYDPTDRGVHIFITPNGEQFSRNFWLDWETKSFWPVVFESFDYQPFCLYTYAAPWAHDAAVLMGCRGDATMDTALISRFKNENACDGSYALESSIKFGPFKLGTMSDGLVNQLMLSLSPDSQDVSLKVQTARTGELSRSAATFESTTNGENLNKRFRPRMRGPSMTITIEGSSGHWAFEALEAEIDLYKEKRP